MRSRLTMSSDGSDLRGALRARVAIMDCLLKVALASCYDSEGDACFGESHGCAFGSVEVGAGLDDLVGEGLGEAVFGEMPVAVHQ